MVNVITLFQLVFPFAGLLRQNVALACFGALHFTARFDGEALSSGFARLNFEAHGTASNDCKKCARPICGRRSVFGVELGITTGWGAQAGKERKNSLLNKSDRSIDQQRGRALEGCLPFRPRYPENAVPSGGQVNLRGTSAN